MRHLAAGIAVALTFGASALTGVGTPAIARVLAKDTTQAPAMDYADKASRFTAPRLARPARAATTSRAMTLTSNSPLQREVFGFVNDYNLGDPNVGYPSWNFRLLSTVAYFALHVNSGDGALIKTDTGWNVFHSTTMTQFIQTAHGAGTKVIVSVNLHDFSTSPTNQVCTGLQPSSAQNTINEVAGQVSGMGIDGVNIDYEANNTTCANGQTSRSEMVAFTKNMRAALPNSYVAIDTYSGSAEDNLEFFDITGLAPYVDSFFVMAYDMDFANYSEAPLNCTAYCFNPISPLTTYRFNVTNSMAQYIALVNSHKVILGQPYYGRRGCVPNLTDAHQYADMSKNFATPTYLYASTVRAQGGVSNFTSHRDPSEGVAEWDTWYDTDFQCNREQYFDDSVSLSYKYDLVNRDDLRGVGLFTLDYAGGAPELWDALATHFSLIPGVPGNVNACTGNASATVSWTAAHTAGGPITSYQVTASPGGITVTVPGNATLATVTGLTAGTAYTFTVRGLNSSGYGVGQTSGSVTPIGTDPLATTYLNWFDKLSLGMVSDNIHISNPATTASAGCVMVPGQAVVPWTANAGQETYVTMPGAMGGPVVVTVTSGGAVLASQRVQFDQSFNEVWARSGAQAATTSYINWYDKASPGMLNDNIHILNPSPTAANVTVSLPGATALKLTVAPGAEAYTTFPQGTIGGPVKVSSDQPVLAAQRVQFDQSFNEVWAQSPTVAATTSYISWYDKASPGMVNDNIHLVNPGTTAASVTVSLPGASAQHVTVAPGAEAYATFPQGTIGGPVKVSSDQPVMASQRVEFDQSFNEVWGQSPTQAASSIYFNWYDKASPGMASDNIHVVNPNATAVTVTVSLAGAPTQTLTVAPGAQAYATFPQGSIGGPVTVTSTQPVLASQRVEFQQSFNEIGSAG